MAVVTVAMRTKRVKSNGEDARLISDVEDNKLNKTAGR
jgi:hypothetical protein